MSHSTLELSELNRKLGRLFMAGLPGKVVDPQTAVLIREYGLGGVILFARNIEEPVQLATLCHDLQDLAMQAHGIPLFLAVDQEGGRVARLNEPFTRFPGNGAIGDAVDPGNKAVEFARVTAREMKLVGLNMNLAPVVDVNRGEPEKHLAGRMFGDDPEKVAWLGSRVIQELQGGGIMAVAKHFPGLGKATRDPHLDLPTIELSRKELEAINLPPFKAAVDAGVTGVMTSHAVYPLLEAEHPGTLSKAVVGKLLREEMGFEGLILTDDLEMGAIEKSWGVPRGAVTAFEAGADILLICKDQYLVKEALRMLRSKVLQGDIPFERIEQSLERIGRAKSVYLEKPVKVSIRRVRRYFKV